MKNVIIVLLLLCFSSSSIADTIFKCETAAGVAVLETIAGGEHTFSLQSSTCTSTVQKLEPIVNRGQGYDSWELPLGNNPQLCSYAIEFIDNGNMQQYSVVQFTEGNRIQHICKKASVVDHVFDNPQ